MTLRALEESLWAVPVWPPDTEIDPNKAFTADELCARELLLREESLLLEASP